MRWPNVCSAPLPMLHKLVQSISILLLLTTCTAAQSEREPGPPLQQRAQQLEPFINESARRYEIDARIVRIVCFIESRYRPAAVSPKGARGPMQFMPETAKRYGLVNPHDARASIDAAAHYLRDLLRKFDGRVDLALAAYNAGEGAVESFRTGRPLVLASGKIINPRRLITGGIPPYPETRAYVKFASALFTNRSSTASVMFSSAPQPKKSSRNANSNVGLRRQNNDQFSLSPAAKKTGSSFIDVQ
jgi:soluble lytic murein transglycosylase-like protein